MHALKQISYFYTAEFVFPEVSAVMACETSLSLTEHISVCVSVILTQFMSYIITHYEGVSSDVTVTRPHAGQAKMHTQFPKGNVFFASTKCSEGLWGLSSSLFN
jgi:hypothetical protein